MLVTPQGLRVNRIDRDDRKSNDRRLIPPWVAPASVPVVYLWPAETSAPPVEGTQSHDRKKYDTEFMK
jgi:hypothetical protein